MTLQFKVTFLILNFFSITLCELPQFTIDSMISLWCQKFYSRLNTQERDIIKKFILQRVYCIEKAEMNFIHPLRRTHYIPESFK